MPSAKAPKNKVGLPSNVIAQACVMGLGCRLRSTPGRLSRTTPVGRCGMLEKLVYYLENPKGYLPGIKMVFASLPARRRPRRSRGLSRPVRPRRVRRSRPHFRLSRTAARLISGSRDASLDVLRSWLRLCRPGGRDDGQRAVAGTAFRLTAASSSGGMRCAGTRLLLAAAGARFAAADITRVTAQVTARDPPARKLADGLRSCRALANCWRRGRRRHLQYGPRGRLAIRCRDRGHQQQHAHRTRCWRRCAASPTSRGARQGHQHPHAYRPCARQCRASEDMGIPEHEPSRSQMPRAALAARNDGTWYGRAQRLLGPLGATKWCCWTSWSTRRARPRRGGR